MVYLDDVYKLLPPAKNNRVLTKRSQSTKDIINQVLTQHPVNVKQAKKIAHLFDTGEAYGTCQNIWNFLKYQIPYKVEPSSEQTTKTLSRIIHDAKYNTGKNDCKHYSSFTGAILDALGYKFIYRFAGYSNYINMPTHVYVVCNEGKNKIFVDAVISGFDVEKPYKLKIDKKIKNKNMSLYQLSGVEDEIIIGTPKKKKTSKILNTVKKVGKNVVKAAKVIKQGAVTINLSIPRTAFLTLLRFNVNGWATGLSKMTANDLKFWMQIGGNRTDLMKAIAEGAKRKRIFGLEDNDTMVGIGEPVTIAGSLTSAAPIIIKIKTLLAKAELISKKAEGIRSTVSKTTDAVKKADAGFKAVTGKSVTDVVFKKNAGQTGTQNNLTTADVKPVSDKDANAVASAIVNAPTKGLNKNLIYIGGAGLLAAFFLFSKRK
jgi:hypothetical protein